MIKKYLWLWILSLAVGVGAGWGIKKLIVGNQDTYTVYVCYKVDAVMKGAAICKAWLMLESKEECQKVRLEQSHGKSFLNCVLEPNETTENLR